MTFDATRCLLGIVCEILWGIRLKGWISFVVSMLSANSQFKERELHRHFKIMIMGCSRGLYRVEVMGHSRRAGGKGMKLSIGGRTLELCWKVGRVYLQTWYVSVGRLENFLDKRTRIQSDWGAKEQDLDVWGGMGWGKQPS